MTELAPPQSHVTSHSHSCCPVLSTLDPPSRHAEGRAGDLPGHAAREASDDVLRHPLQGDPAGLQEVHARRKLGPELPDIASFRWGIEQIPAC